MRTQRPHARFYNNQLTRTRLRDLLSGRGVEDQSSVAPDLAEVEHLADGTGDAVKRAGTDSLPAQPIVFDESNHRSLVSDGVVHDVLEGPWRDHDQRLPRTVAATAQRVRIAGVDAGQRGQGGAASVRPCQRVRRTSGLVYDRADLVVIPAVRVIVKNDDCSAAPGRLFLQEVDQLYNRELFIQGIGVASVPILNPDVLDKAHGREIACLHRMDEIIDVIVVVGRATVSDFVDALRPSME